MDNNLTKEQLNKIADRVIQSVMFHFANYGQIDRKKISELKKTPAYLLSQADIDYVDFIEKCLNYIQQNNLIESFYSYDFVCALNSVFTNYNFILFKKVKGVKDVQKTRTVDKKVLFFTKKIEENYTVQEEDIYYVPYFKEDSIQFIKCISNAFKDSGLTEIIFLIGGSETFLTIKEIEKNTNIEHNLINNNLKFHFNNDEVEEIDTGVFVIKEKGICMGIRISLDCVLKSKEIRHLSRTYYENHYGHIEHYED